MRARPGRALALLAGIAALTLAVSLLLLAAAALIAREIGPPPGATLVELPHAGPIVGGWSGIDISQDGSRFWVVTDRGMRTQGAVLREPDGTLAGIDAPRPHVLPGLYDDLIDEFPDAEGLDIREPDGDAYVTFEGIARLRGYGAGAARATWKPGFPERFDLHPNRGLEAVARGPRGALYTLAERPSAPGRPFLLYRLLPSATPETGIWEVAARLESGGGWRAVGADFGPDAALYLLERRFAGVGFANRVRRFSVPESSSDRVLAGRVVFTSPLGLYGNLEGIGVWRDGSGQLRALMVADDNTRWFQRAHLVEALLGVPPLASVAEQE
ncbi:MAG: esterase-like activity of phytase family protein [Pseudomonadota bacterium]